MHAMYAHMIDDFIGVKLGAELGGKQINVHSAHIGITPLVKPKSASSSDLSSLTLNEQLRGELVAGYLCISQPQDLDFGPDSLEQNWSCGNFSHHF